MMNTSSCTRHPAITFPSVTPSVPTEHDYNFSSLYGNLSYSGDISGDMSALDELFLHDFCHNPNFDLDTEDNGSAKTKDRLSNIFDFVQGDDQLRPFDTASTDALSRNEATGENPAIGNGGESPNDGGSHNHFQRQSPRALPQEECFGGSIGSDIEKRKCTQPVVPRSKGRPVKSAQNLSGVTGCKPLIQCFTCSKTFNNSSALAKHKLIHSDDRKYSCAICSKSFKRQDHLHGHMMTHSSKKPYECCFARCDKSYCDARSLRRHHENHHFQLIENSQREFSLNSGDGQNFDSSAFKDSHHWTTGFNPLDEPKPVKCLVCGKRFRNLPALNGHMRLHGGYMRQVKSEISETSDVDKDAISESLETSCGSMSSEDNIDQSALKKESCNCMDSFPIKSACIKQELISDWNNSSQNWCKNDAKYTSKQDSEFDAGANVKCFYSIGQSTFQNESVNSTLVHANIAPHPSLSSPCLAASPPSTPGQQCYNNVPYNTTFFRRAITPICHSNLLNASNKCQLNIQRAQNLTSGATLQRASSSVFPHSPFSSNNYTPASATASNYFQFPSSYEDTSIVSPPSSQNHNQLIYAHQFPSTSPFLNIQSRPRTPFTPNTPGRTCRQQQFYYNHGDESPVTPSMRGYSHKTPTYHPYHSNYRYYSQLKHHNSNQNFSITDSEFNKCIEMLEKGNINNLVSSHSNAGNVPTSIHFPASLKQAENLMEFSSVTTLNSGMDLNCMVEETPYCSSVEHNNSSDVWTSMHKPAVSTQAAMMDPMMSHEIQNLVYHGNSSFGASELKSCDSFNNMNKKIKNGNSTYEETANNNNQHNFGVNYNFTPTQRQHSQSIYGSSLQSDNSDHHLITTMPMDSSTQNIEKKKKKHKPEPLWIPANVSNFANTGGRFIEQSNDCCQSSASNCRKKVPPPYICVTPISAASCQGNVLPDLRGDQNSQVLPNSAPPFQDFSLDLNDSINPVNGF